MVLTSGKALWSIICGQCVLPSDEVVGEELEDCSDHILEGTLFYKQWSEEEHKLWCKKSSLKREQEDFVFKLGSMLDLCSEQAWGLFQLFLQYEYRGSVAQLQIASLCEREELNLLHQVFSFFLSDPLHMLSCRRHILSSDSSHPYDKLFKEFIKKVLNADSSLGSRLATQLKKMNAKKPPPKRMSPHLPLKATQARISYELSALKHQLATLLVYYGSPQNFCSPETVHSLLQLAQRIGLGRDLCENVSINERSNFAIHLEAIDALHSFLLTLVINCDSDPETNPLCKPEWVSKISPLIASMGSRPWQFPPLLAWAILQGRKASLDMDSSTEEAAKYSRLIQRAVKGKAFQYMRSALQIAALRTDELLFKIGSSITYSLMCIVGSCIDLEKVDLIQEAQELSSVCLAYDPPSLLFWTEPDGGASVLLPSALEVFPHRPSPLLDMMKPLASAGEFSAGKVVDLIGELESFTWPLTPPNEAAVYVSGSQCVSRTDLYFLPDIVIPKETHGLIMNLHAGKSGRNDGSFLVNWQTSFNGWTVIMSSMKLLEDSMSRGSVMDEWCVEIAVKGLSTAATLFNSDAKLQLTPQFKEFRSMAQILLVSVSKSTKPEASLVCSLMDFFSQVTKINPSSFWTNFEGCSLLPSLPLPKTDKGDSRDLLSRYRAGVIRCLICGVDSDSDSFVLLRHICSVVENSLVKNVDFSGVRGFLVFVTKEVVPGLLLWRCSDISKKLDAVEAVFSLLHRSLEESVALDSSLRRLLASELSNANGGAGETLKSVLESSANLHSSLDQPTEWPHSSHAKKLTRLAQLALSLAHRLVSRYLTDGDSVRRFFLEGSSRNSHSSAILMRHGASTSASRSPHLALTIAQFVYHRLNPRLPYLALRTLTRLAKEIAVPLVACLGSEAEGLRDCLVNRFDSASEDLLVKVALLRLLTLSTTHQPGLLRLFLSPPQSFLGSVVSAVKSHKKCKSEAESDFMLSLTELITAVYEKKLATATSFLNAKSEFWDDLLCCLDADKSGLTCDSIAGCIFKTFSLKCYDSEMDATYPEFKKLLQSFLDSNSIKFSSWVEYIFVTYIDKILDSMEDESPGNDVHADTHGTNELLESASQFFVVILYKTPSLMTDNQKRLLGNCTIGSLLNLMERDSGDSRDRVLLLLSEIHLSVLHHCGRLMARDKTYIGHLSRLLSALQSSVIQTRVACQVLILSATLKVFPNLVTSTESCELGSLLVNSVVSIVQQHCSFNSTKVENIGYSLTTCLALSTALLHQCLQPLTRSMVENYLQSSNLVPILLDAAVRHTQNGNGFVVKEIQRLFLLIVRRTGTSTGLTTACLAESVSLILASKAEVDFSILSDLMWCAAFSLKSEGGAEGLEGAISILAVHSQTLTEALTKPCSNASLALATAALISILASFHRMWRVIHPGCFQQMMEAAAKCVHTTTKILQLKESLEREVCGHSLTDLNSSRNELSQSSSYLSEPTINLINQLLHMLSLCLQSIRSLSPDLVELLCVRGSEGDVATSQSDLVQPTVRRHSADHQYPLPNLATLADILDLYLTLIPKDARSSTASVPRSSTGAPSKIDASLLSRCAEEAIYLLLTHSTSFVLNPEAAPRDARDVCTFVADETSSFFSHWFGRRSVSTPSPLPPLSPRTPLSDLPYFMLCRQIVSSLCHSNKA